MMHKFRPRAALALAACCSSALLGGSAAQASFSAEYVFGDSLSDNGNLASVEGGPFLDPPSFDNSFTNGPVAVQLLAQSLGLSANASLWLTGTSPPAGTNYAVGGATAATPDLASINLLSQVAAYSGFALGHADPDALYVVMIGGNDVRNAALSAGEGAVTAGVRDELTAISDLADEGAKHILVVNVPNVGLIPEFTQEDPDPTAAAAATQFSIDYDTDLAGGLAHPTTPLPSGTMLTDFNLFALNQSILDNAAKLGFTNTTDPCYDFTGLPTDANSATGCTADNINQFLYWNDIHPTAPVQALWAQGLREAVPEPSTWAMLVMGFVGLAFAGCRRGARARAAA
jgi:phospholipase/lecithinase/hemolysin